VTTVGGPWQPLALASGLTTVAEQLLERPIVLGEKARVAARLMVARVPEAIVNEHRRKARQTARKKGYTPSQAPLTRLAGPLWITKVPSTLWQTATVLQVSPLRWQSALLLQSWKSDLHGASLTTTQEDTPFGSLSGRMRLMGLHEALCPQRRAHLWGQKKRALSRRKLVRHVHAVAARWMQAIFQSDLALRRFLIHVCATATRLAAKAARQRRTSAHILHEH
jgi:hypothetical protein